jgi:hypothetical protein
MIIPLLCGSALVLSGALYYLFKSDKQEEPQTEETVTPVPSEDRQNSADSRKVIQERLEKLRSTD